MFDIGTADEDICSSDLPLLTLQHKLTGELRKVCDMGRGGNGTWADVGAFRAPPLRGLAARAPSSTTARRATSRRWSTSTTTASTWASAARNATTSSRS